MSGGENSALEYTVLQKNKEFMIRRVIQKSKGISWIQIVPTDPRTFTLNKMNHASILELHEDSEAGRIYIADDVQDTLTSYLMSNKQHQTILSIFKQIAGFVDYLHNQGIAHTELGTDCFLIRSDGQIKALPFKHQGVIYTAPERIVNSPDIDMKREDMFQLGCMMYEMLSSESLQVPNHDEVEQMITYSKLLGRPKETLYKEIFALLPSEFTSSQVKQILLKADVPLPFIRIVERLLVFNPMKRLNITQLKAELSSIKVPNETSKFHIIPSIVKQKQFQQSKQTSTQSQQASQAKDSSRSTEASAYGSRVNSKPPFVLEDFIARIPENQQQQSTAPRTEAVVADAEKIIEQEDENKENQDRINKVQPPPKIEASHKRFSSTNRLKDWQHRVQENNLKKLEEQWELRMKEEEQFQKDISMQAEIEHETDQSIQAFLAMEAANKKKEQLRRQQQLDNEQTIRERDQDGLEKRFKDFETLKNTLAEENRKNSITIEYVPKSSAQQPQLQKQYLFKPENAEERYFRRDDEDKYNRHEIPKESSLSRRNIEPENYADKEPENPIQRIRKDPVDAKRSISPKIDSNSVYPKKSSLVQPKKSVRMIDDEGLSNSNNISVDENKFPLPNKQQQWHRTISRESRARQSQSQLQQPKHEVNRSRDNINNNNQMDQNLYEPVHRPKTERFLNSNNLMNKSKEISQSNLGDEHLNRKKTRIVEPEISTNNSNKQYELMIEQEKNRVQQLLEQIQEKNDIEKRFQSEREQRLKRELEDEQYRVRHLQQMIDETNERAERAAKEKQIQEEQRRKEEIAQMLADKEYESREFYSKQQERMLEQQKAKEGVLFSELKRKDLEIAELSHKQEIEDRRRADEKRLLDLVERKVKDEIERIRAEQLRSFQDEIQRQKREFEMEKEIALKKEREYQLNNKKVGPSFEEENSTTFQDSPLVQSIHRSNSPVRATVAEQEPAYGYAEERELPQKDIKRTTSLKAKPKVNDDRKLEGNSKDASPTTNMISNLYQQEIEFNDNYTTRQTYLNQNGKQILARRQSVSTHRPSVRIYDVLAQELNTNQGSKNGMNLNSNSNNNGRDQITKKESIPQQSSQFNGNQKNQGSFFSNGSRQTGQPELPSIKSARLEAVGDNRGGLSSRNNNEQRSTQQNNRSKQESKLPSLERDVKNQQSINLSKGINYLSRKVNAQNAQVSQQVPMPRSRNGSRNTLMPPISKRSNSSDTTPRQINHVNLQNQPEN